MREMILAVAAMLVLAPLRADAARLAGDCNGSQLVEVADVVAGVNVVLGSASLATCPSLDSDADGRVEINEVVALVIAVMNTPPPPFGGVCGNFAVDPGEQCDDGNADGGACTSGCRFAGPGLVDQTWIGLVGPCGGSRGSNNIGLLGPMFQQFIPTLPTLNAVLLNIGVGSPDASNSGVLEVQVRDGSPSGAVVAMAQSQVSGASSSTWQRLDFAEPVAVVPGATYVIEISSSDDTLALNQEQGDECAITGYPLGSAIGPDGTPYSGDWLFATVGATEEVE